MVYSYTKSFYIYFQVESTFETSSLLPREVKGLFVVRVIPMTTTAQKEITS